MQELQLSIHGMNVHFYAWGKKHKPTIVCFHGLCNSGFSFKELSDALQENFYVLAFDSPGHGKTSPFQRKDDYLFSNLAQWYDEIIEQVVDDPFYVLGHSWGGDLALHYTKHNSKKVKGVILLDGGYTFPDFQEDMTYQKVYTGWKEYMDQSSVFNSWEGVLKEYKQYTNRWNKTIESMVSSLFEKRENKFVLIPSTYTVLSIIKAFFAESFQSTFPYIHVPVLLIHATLPTELDNAREKGVSTIIEKVNNVTVVPFANTNHLVHWEQPELVANEVHQWILSLK